MQKNSRIICAVPFVIKGRDYTPEAGTIRAVIPNGATKIYSYAFSDYAFSGCSTLSQIILPRGLSEIGRYAFSDCRQLNVIEIPRSIRKIRLGAFKRCPLRPLVPPMFSRTDLKRGFP